MTQAKSKKAFDWRSNDPGYQKELEKYGSAAPSREYIIQYLTERGAPLGFAELCGALKLEDFEAQALKKRLRAMERDGQLICNRRGDYGVVGKMDLVPGRVVGHADGHGFLVPDDGSDNLFIAPRHMRQLIHGDRAMVRIDGVDYRGRREAAVVEILERNTARVVGRFVHERGVSYVIPDDKRINHDVLIPPEDARGAKSGQIVIVEIVEQPDKRSRPLG